MSEAANNKNIRDDEIDLLDLFNRMGRALNRWAKALGRAILIVIVFLLRRWIPLGLSLILGVGVSYLKKTTSPSFYSSDMVMRNNAVAISDMITYINRLHNFCAEGNKPALTDALKLSNTSINNIIDISAFWIIDRSKDGIPDYVDYRNNHDVYDTTNIRMTDRLDIRVIIKSPQELTLVRNAIVSFIESDSLFQQRNRIRLRQNHQMLARFDYDITQLDSIQKVKYFEEKKNIQRETGGQMVFLQEQKTQLLYPDIHTLYWRKQTLEAEQELYKEIVTVMSEFSLPAKRQNGIIYYGKKIMPLFFCLTLLGLILLANRKKLTEVYRKY